MYVFRQQLLPIFAAFLIDSLGLPPGFISKQWHVTSRGMFAGSCIGVIFLVISLEFLRRMQREYDGYIRRKDMGAATSLAARQQGETPDTSASSDHEVGGKHQRPTISTSPLTGNVPPLYRPHVDRMTLLQRQFIRALIHMVQFAVAYFIMLLAMYYNGSSQLPRPFRISRSPS